MLTNLIASKPQKQRSLAGVVLSISLHTVMLLGASYATLRATEKKDARTQQVIYVEPKSDPPPPAPQPPVAVPWVAKGFRVLTAPLNIPDALPTIDLSQPPTNPRDFSGLGPKAGSPTGVESARPTDQPYFDFQVEKPVLQVPGSAAPRYPEILKSAGIEGNVFASFVVDTTGHVEPRSFTVLRATHELFVAAVRNALPNMKFFPAEVGGKKVKQLVQQPFVFSIAR